MAPVYLPVLKIFSYEHLPYSTIPITYFCPVILFLPLSFVLTLCSFIHHWLVPRPSGTWAGRPEMLGVIWACLWDLVSLQNKQMNVSQMK